MAVTRVIEVPDSDALDPDLKRERTFKTPMIYSNALGDYANWNNIFMTRLLDGMTMYKPKKPPSHILALGNGFRAWSLQAAEAWPECKIVGHSILYDFQNFGGVFDAKGLTGRLNFITRDILTGLDYPDNTFDMVRATYCSLSLTEKEWQPFVKEIHRVLKPGGFLEITEDDLLFPGVRESDLRTPPSSPNRRQSTIPPQTTADRPNSYLNATSTWDSDTKTLASFGTEKHSSQDSGQSLHEPPHLDTSVDPYFAEHHLDPLNHSKLWHAWHGMLNERSISSQPTSFLPLYLSVFENFRALPALEILTPGSARTPPKSSPRSSKEDASASRWTISEQKIDPAPYRHLVRPTVKDKADTSLLSDDTPEHFLPAWEPLQLARTVSIVKSCKEAIWEAYDKLYGAGPTIMPVAGRDREPVKGTAREEFDIVWCNWETDMMSRVNMRELVSSKLKWPAPTSEPSEMRVWRDSLWASQTMKGSSIVSSSSPLSSQDVCRCVRGFVAWKAQRQVPSKQ